MNKLYIGILSGTSMDAIDVAAFDFSNPQILVAQHSYQLPTEYKSKYTRVILNKSAKLQELGELDSWTGHLFANAILEFLNKCNINKKHIAAIGSHGQTIWHEPNSNARFTWQVADPNIIACNTNITTVADFRRMDVAAGGQGAPLAPIFHQQVFGCETEDRIIANIGGIANISVLSKNFIGFDTGPGNCLMDAWVKQYFAREYDHNGELAELGTVNLDLLDACLKDKFFSLAPPKSSGLEHFNIQWLQDKITECGQSNVSDTDVLATLLELTATTIFNEVIKLKLNNPSIYLCGGGAQNIALCNLLSKKFGYLVHTTSMLGIDPDWVEAGLFAWLAKCRLENIPLNLSSITGSKQPIVLGAVYSG